MSARMNGDTLRAHRACLLYFAHHDWITWNEYNRLIKNVLVHERRRLCESKQRFEMYAQAARAACRSSRSRTTGHWVAKIYKCPVCNGFHLTDIDVPHHRAHERIKQRRWEVEHG